MSKVNSLLSERLKASTEKTSKMSSLAELSSSGNLSSFSGVFKVSSLTDKEKDLLKLLLEEYQEEEQDISQDFLNLSSITSEVKAINNQAIILHGERIKKAQEILKKYKEGAFTLWLIQTYGNRQTPYNFLQYFELYNQISRPLLPKYDEMPRQAAYTLACRTGPLAIKEEIIQSYQGESKDILLERIRKTFPLPEKDKRGQNVAINVLKSLKKITAFLENNTITLSPSQEKTAKQLLKTLQKQILPGEASYDR